MNLPCQADPELWVSTDSAARRDAARLCRDCPIIRDCLTGAIERREMNHVWGGRDFSDVRTRPKLPPPAPQPINHGTMGGYRTHKRRGIPFCEPCRRAEANARQARRERAS